jgi:hypothetical protein
MVRRRVAALIGLVLLAGPALAADLEVTGKIVKVDPAKRAITVETEDGRQDFTVGVTTRVLDAKGAASKEGLADKRFAAGAEVKLVKSPVGRILREVHFLEKKTAAKPKEPPAKAADKKDDKEPEKKESKGTAAKVLAVDVEKGTAQVQTEDGKKRTLQIDEDVAFLGPRGGVSAKKIKDDRFAAGSEVRIEFDAAGKKVKVIHLPVRKSADKDDEQ